MKAVLPGKKSEMVHATWRGLLQAQPQHGKQVISLVDKHDDLAANPSAAAHLIHGSPENRFEVVYAAAGLSAREIESVGFESGDIDELMRRYDPGALQDGWHRDSDGSDFYFIRNPSLGLWKAPQ